MERTDPRPEDHEICVMNADGTGKPQRLTNDGKVDLSPSWSPNGERIAFQKQVVTVPGARFQIWSMKANGTDPTADQLRRYQPVAGLGRTRDPWID